MSIKKVGDTRRPEKQRRDCHVFVSVTFWKAHRHLSHMLRSSARDNIDLLQQGIALLDSVTPDQYSTAIAICFGSSMGGHFRHVVEHYEAFLRGLETGHVDYEARPRDLTVEGDAGVARARLASLVTALEHVSVAPNRSLRVKVETAPPETAEPWIDSSLLRELEMLLGHTVHHYALIAITCRLLGYEPTPDFGMAPSTLRYRQAQAHSAVCAR